MGVSRPMCCSFLTWLGHDFLRDKYSFCLSAVSLSRQRHNILDFSCCPLSRILHVTLANPQKFGFEFYLRSSPSAFSGLPVHQLIISLPCYTVLTRPNKGETTLHDCNSGLSVWTIMSLSHYSFYVVSALRHFFQVLKTAGNCMATG